jgi:hypothetical protein
MEEKIIKREEGLQLKAGLFSRRPKGSLVLTHESLSFISKDEKLLEIPLSQIVSVNSKKGVGNGVDWLVVTHKQDGKEQKAEIMHFGFFDGFGLGIASRLKGPYFVEWEKLIDDERLGRNASAASGADELGKLADLKERGVITEEEFAAKKKQLLGL